MKSRILAFILLLSSSAFAQLSFEAKVDTNQIKLGEPIQLELSAKVPKAAEYTWPLLESGQNGIEIIESGKLDSLIKGDWIQLHQRFTLTSFDSGEVEIPALELSVEDEEVQRSSPIAILVYFPEIKEEQDYFDIKAPREIPFNYWLLAYWGLGAAGLAALIYYLWKFWQKRKNRGEKQVEEIQIPPIEWALEELNKLEAKGLWQDGKAKAYFSELDEILKIFLERKFGLKALESTAEELIVKIKPLCKEERHFNNLKNSLRLSAMVKFARQQSLPEENVQALDAVRDFVNSQEAPKLEADV
ncbi:hypothetical protein [Croceimicrobium sp.]|uniref:hypothetical protein n=1 Tax=Croceimicrobium sp. TaxID=2828340 RepID=UPI003BAC9619